MTARRAGGVSVAVAALLVLAGCGDMYEDIVYDNTSLCRPEATRACHCDDGAPGIQVCLAAGDDYGACDCMPDAGAPEVDAALDATADAAIDGPADGATDILLDASPPLD